MITPDGRTIRVPAFAVAKLRRLGALLGKTNRLSPRIHRLLRPEFECLCGGLRHLLGEDLSEPSWVLCGCRSCRDRAAGPDNIPLPGRNRVDDGGTTALVREIVRRRKYS